MNKFPQKLWASRVNLSGLYSKKPVRVYRRVDRMHGRQYAYWDAGGDLEILDIGLHLSKTCVRFASDSHLEVENFINEIEQAQKEIISASASSPLGVGFKVVSHMIGAWAWTLR